MKKYIKILLPLCILISGVSCKKESPSISSLPVRTSMPFTRGENGYEIFRIPTVVRTNNGTIMAFASGRFARHGDYGPNDIVAKQSVDNGHTWSTLQVIADAGENRCHNACPVYLPESNKTIVLYCQNVGAGTEGAKDSVFKTESTDDGKTWSDYVEITSQIDEGLEEIQLGPVHGIVKQHDPNKGRIIIPGCHSRTGMRGLWSFVIYSDDGGETWHQGGRVPKTWTGECTLAELSDGSLMLNIRDQTNSHKRLVSMSSDSGLTWSEPKKDEKLTCPTCQASLLNFGQGNDGNDILLFSNPESIGTRSNGTLKMSTDGGKSWVSSYSYTGQDRAGYSDIFSYGDGENVGVIYEFGMTGVGIAFQNIPLSKLNPIK